MFVKAFKKKNKVGSRSQVTIRFRIRGSKKPYQFLYGLAGANRYLWNVAVACLSEQYDETGQSKSSDFSLCTYREHKKEAQWLKAYPAVLTGLQDVSNAFQQFLRAYPKFKKKRKAKKSFAIDHRLSDHGYFRLRRGLRIKLMGWKRVNRYSNPKCGHIFEVSGT